MDSADEHLKRIQAEGEAQAASQRLAVAQQQFCEYLTERATTEETLAAQAQALEELLRAAAGAAQADPAALLAQVQRLREGLTAAAFEVKTAATQMQAETERKRTSTQADLENPSSDVEMKRARDESSRGGDDDNDAEDEEEDTEFTNGEEINGAAIATNGVKSASGLNDNAHDNLRERAKYIPLRLLVEERRILRLLEGALNVSEYTDKVDILSYRNKSARVHAQIKDICAILCGLTVAQNFKRGQSLIADRDFEQLSSFFQDCFEIGRRHKIMNPEKMRDTYGKLCYMLMDSSEPEMIELLGFKCVRPLRTVAAL